MSSAVATETIPGVEAVQSPLKGSYPVEDDTPGDLEVTRLARRMKTAFDYNNGDDRSEHRL